MKIDDFIIEEYLDSKGVDFKDYGSNVGPNNVNINCFNEECDDEGYHLGIEKTKLVYHCWKCGTSGNIVKLVANIEECSIKYAIELLKNNTYGYITLEEALKDIWNKDAEEKTKNTELSLPEGSKKLLFDDSYSKCRFNKIAFGYLLNRGFFPVDLGRANPHYCMAGRYKNRIIFPVYFKGKLVNYVGRAWSTYAETRYKNCLNEEAVMGRRELLYGYDELNTKDVVLTEGIFDCLKVGLGKGLASFGTEVTPEQIELLVGLKLDRLTILFDGGAFDKACAVVDELSSFIPKIRAIKLKDKQDPGSMTKLDIDKLLR